MEKARTPQLGARVKIGQQHWKRGGQVGRVISYEPRGRNNWLIQFETKYPGGEIDGENSGSIKASFFQMSLTRAMTRQI